MRANKATSAWGLEVRVPFLDKEFIDVAMSMDPEWKLVWAYRASQLRHQIKSHEVADVGFLGGVQYDPKQGRMEKWVMRKAFDDEEQPYLPKVLLLLTITMS